MADDAITQGVYGVWNLPCTVVGNLFTIAGQKRGVIMSRAEPTTLVKVHIIFIRIICFPLGAWQAAQELLAGCMRPAGHRLPTPALVYLWPIHNS